jgi:AraC-like DNA-binding protein
LRYLERRPCAGLAGTIECLWALVSEGPAPTLQPVLPDGCVEVVLHLGEPFGWLTGEGLQWQPRAVVVGPIARALWLQPPARVQTLGVRFRPGRFGAWGPPAVELVDRVVPLADVWGAAVADWPDLLRAVPAGERLVHLEGLLLALRPRQAGLDPAALAGADRLLRSRGAARIAGLGASAGLGERQFGRRFEAAVGVGPKRFARVARVHAALLHLREGLDPATAALRAGYADQAHFTRDFASLAGLPPGRFQAAAPLAAQFTTAERLLGYFLGE